MGENGEGFTGSILKDTWTITMGAGWKLGKEVGRTREGGRVWGKGRKLYLNNNKKCLKILKNQSNIYLV